MQYCIKKCDSYDKENKIDGIYTWCDCYISWINNPPYYPDIESSLLYDADDNRNVCVNCFSEIVMQIFEKLKNL